MVPNSGAIASYLVISVPIFAGVYDSLSGKLFYTFHFGKILAPPQKKQKKHWFFEGKGAQLYLHFSVIFKLIL